MMVINQSFLNSLQRVSSPYGVTVLEKVVEEKPVPAMPGQVLQQPAALHYNPDATTGLRDES